MRWQNKEISALSDQELTAADWATKEMLSKLNTVRDSDKFKKKMLNQPTPNINPSFLELRNEIEVEIEKRKNK